MDKPASSEATDPRLGLTFALVHGGAHGAWCWQRVIGALDLMGVKAIALDLPCEDDGAGTAEYARVVLSALEDVASPVVLVGHSLGGLTIPVVAAQRDIRKMIFVASLLPSVGLSLREQQATEPDMSFPYRKQAGGLMGRFYNRCTTADALWARGLLRRQSTTPFTERTPLRRWPDVPSSYVICGDDRARNPDWARVAVRERLKTTAVELAEADHSPFLSQPGMFAGLLLSLAISSA